MRPADACWVAGALLIAVAMVIVAATAISDRRAEQRCEAAGGKLINGTCLDAAPVVRPFAP